MKEILTIILASAFVICLKAQNYEPTSTWPYLYPDFTAGILYVNVSGEQKDGLYNIHILEGRLHFIEGDLIKEASPADVYSVRIGDDIYLNAGGTMMRVLAESDAGVVLQETVVDKTRLNSSSAAYGASANSMAAWNLSSIEQTGSMVNTNHMQLKNSRNEGEILPLTGRTYLMGGGKIVFAAKKDVAKAVGEDRLKAFLKGNSVKWKDPQSLLAVVELIAKAEDRTAPIEEKQ